jgi:hypothetical protein
MNLEDLKVLAGIRNPATMTPYVSINVTHTTNINVTPEEKAIHQRENDVKPGTPEWFKLWFSKPYLTGERPF